MTLDFITEMAWKSAAISGAALLLVALFRSRSAADRAAMLRVAIGLLLLLPLVSAVLPELKIEALSAPAIAEATDPVLLSDLTTEAALPAPRSSTALASRLTISPDLVLTILYLAGLSFALIRLAAGIWTLRRWTMESRNVLSSDWTGALGRMVDTAANARTVRLLASPDVPAALSWGFRNPVILLNPALLDRPEDAEAIVGHEYAHILRGDWPQLMLSRLVSALFWFNPLVWLLEREVIQNAEEAADNQALKILEPTRYAQTLVSCVHHACRSDLPANSMACGDGMARRVRAILDGARERTPSGMRWTIAAIAGCTAFAAPLAAVKLVAPEVPVAPEPPSAPPEPMAPEAPTAPEAEVAPLAPLPPAGPMAVTIRPAQKVPAVTAGAAPSAPDRRAHDHEAQVAALRAGVATQLRKSVAHQPRAHAHPNAVNFAKFAVLGPTDLPQITIVRQDLGGEVRHDIGAAAAEAVKRANDAVRRAELAAAHARRDAARSMAHGAAGMERGAEGMERGARQMAEHARKLRNADYREEIIARKARRGETVTHEELLDAIPELEEGAAELLRGAEEMRQGAVKMRSRTIN